SGDYNVVKNVFDQYGIPEYVWYPIMMAESTGNPNAVGDNGCSIGLFQLNRCGGQGAGYSAYSLRDPATNAQVAAQYIRPAYDAVKSETTPETAAAETAIRSGHPGGSP